MGDAAQLRLAHLIAQAFSQGETTQETQLSVAGALPQCAYVSLCIPGNDTVAVCTSNLAVPALLDLSLLHTKRITCLWSCRPELLPAERAASFLPLAARRTADTFLCIPVPRPEFNRMGELAADTGLVHAGTSPLGALFLGLAPHLSDDSIVGLIRVASGLVRCLAVALCPSAVASAQSIVSFVLPMPLTPEPIAAAAPPSSDAQRDSKGDAHGGAQQSEPACCRPPISVSVGAAGIASSGGSEATSCAAMMHHPAAATALKLGSPSDPFQASGLGPSSFRRRNSGGAGATASAAGLQALSSQQRPGGRR